MNQSKFRFKIDDLTLETIPLKRLAEYLADLAALVWEVKNVHLVGIETGSVEAILLTESPRARAIEDRIHHAAGSNGVKPTGPREAIKAFRSLTDRLAEDKTGAVFMFEAGAEILRFPNQGRPQAAVYGPFNQEGSLDGVVVRLGGINDPVPVHLESDTGSYQCLASRALARELAKHIFEATLRVYGAGRWLRTAEGDWTLESFMIRDFHTLNEEPLSAVVARLRAVNGGGWAEIDNPLAEAKRIRDRDDEDG